MSFGMIPAFFVGGLLAFLRQYYFFRQGIKFRKFQPNTKSRLIYKCVH